MFSTPIHNAMNEKPQTAPRVPEPLPSVGRIVHYRESYRGELRAAIVTGVERAHDPRSPIDATIFRRGAEPRPMTEIPSAPDPDEAGWSWPPRA